MQHPRNHPDARAMLSLGVGYSQATATWNALVQSRVICLHPPNRNQCLLLGPCQPSSRNPPTAMVKPGAYPQLHP